MIRRRTKATASADDGEQVGDAVWETAGRTMGETKTTTGLRELTPHAADRRICIFQSPHQSVTCIRNHTHFFYHIHLYVAEEVVRTMQLDVLPASSALAWENARPSRLSRRPKALATLHSVGSSPDSANRARSSNGRYGYALLHRMRVNSNCITVYTKIRIQS